MVITEFITTNPLFSQTSSLQKALASDNIQIVHLKKGNSVYKEKDVPEYIYFIKKGSVELKSDKIKLKKESESIIGQEALFEHHTYLTTAICLEDCELFSIPISIISEFPKSTHQFLYEDFFNQFSEKKEEDLFLKSKISKTDTISWGEIIGWLLSIVLPIALYSLSANWSLALEGRIFLSLLTSTTIMWIFRLLPEFIPGIFLILGTLVLGLAPINVTLSGLSSETFILMMSVFSLSLMVVNSGLISRILLYFFNKLPSTTFWQSSIVFFISSLLTFIVPTIVGRCQIVTPLVADMLKLSKINFQTILSTRMAISAFYGTSIFASVVLSSSLMNFVVLSLLPEQEQQQFYWIGWFKAAIVYGVVMGVLFSIITWLFFKRYKLTSTTEKPKKFKKEILGKLRPSEWTSIVSAALLMLGLLTSSIHKINPAWIALFLLFAVLSLQFIKKSDFQRYIDWPFILFLSSAVTITATMKFLGLDFWVSDIILNLISFTKDPYYFLTMIILFTILLRFILPIPPSIVLLSMTFIPIAVNYNANPWTAAFVILVTVDMWFLPYQNNFYLVFEEHSTKNGRLFYNKSIFLSFNLWMNLARLAGIYASFPYWKSLGLI